MQVLTNNFAVINEFMTIVPVDVVGLIKKLGIKLKYSDLPNDVCGSIVCEKKGKYLIEVNANHPKTRQRFTMAHELGHYIYHRSKIGDGITDDKMYRSSNVNIKEKEETQANRFAVILLMPRIPIETLIKEGKSQDQIADILEVSRQAFSIYMKDAKLSV